MNIIEVTPERAQQMQGLNKENALLLEEYGPRYVGYENGNHYIINK